jgi:hypothetical protein
MDEWSYTVSSLIHLFTRLPVVGMTNREPGFFFELPAAHSLNESCRSSTATCMGVSPSPVKMQGNLYAPLSTRVRPSFAEDSLILFKIPQHDQCLLIPLACDTIGILRGIKHPRAPILQA